MAWLIDLFIVWLITGVAQNGKHSNRIKSISVRFAGVYRCGGRNYWYDTE